MKAGFTGSRDLKLTDIQKHFFSEQIEQLKITEIHHGDCLGGDEDVHEFIRNKYPDIKIIVHPPTDAKLRAFCKGDIVLKAKDYNDRNHDIVDSSEILFALPKNNSPRSGTIATMNYAEKKKIKVIKLN